MSGDFNIKKYDSFDNSCNCQCNSSSFNYTSSFSNPCLGVFSPTIFGMIHGDYSFYNPVPDMGMFTYNPCSSYSMPFSSGGFSFDTSLFTNLLDLTFQRMNQQSLFGGANDNFAYPGMGVNPGTSMSPFTFSNTPAAPSTPLSEEEKTDKETNEKAKKDYDATKKFFDKYISYLKGSGSSESAKELEDKLKEIENLKVETTETNDKGEVKTKSRNATSAEKLEKLKSLYNETFSTNEIKNFVLSNDSGLTFGSGNGSLEDSESVTALLNLVGYDREISKDEEEEIKNSVKGIKSSLSSNNGNIRDNISKITQSNDLIYIVSRYNTVNKSNLMSDIVDAYEKAKGEDKRALEDCIKDLNNALKEKAEEIISKGDYTSYMTSEQKSDIQAKINQIDKASIYGSVEAFNNLYKALRFAMADVAVAKLEKKYEALPNSKTMFDFIKTETEKDIKVEIPNNKEITGLISTGNGLYRIEGVETQRYKKLSNGKYQIYRKNPEGRWAPSKQCTSESAIREYFAKRQLKEDAKKAADVLNGLYGATSDSEWKKINAAIGMEDNYNESESGKLDNKQNQIVDKDNILYVLNNMQGKGLFAQILSENHDGKETVANKLLSYLNERLIELSDSDKLTDAQKRTINEYIGDAKKKINFVLNEDSSKKDGKEIDEKISNLIAYLKQQKLM